MSDHVVDLLGAYLDGELQGKQLQKVETHLAECQTCRAELASLQALSGILQEAPAPDFPSPDRFVSNLTLQLARQPVTPPARRALEIGWWLAPVGLLAALLFIHTSILVSDLFAAASDFGFLNSGPARLMAGAPAQDLWSEMLGQLGVLSGSSLHWAEAAESFTRDALPRITWQVSLAMLYLGWVALWWARQTRPGPGQLWDGAAGPPSKKNE